MLLIDIGNSRIKTGLVETDGIRLQAPLAWRDVDRNEVWPRALAGISRCDQVYVSNVAGPEIAADLSVWLTDQWSVSPQVVAVQREIAGVVTRYEHPEQLGVDRWLAAIAGYHLAGGAACVVDGGTALTIDVVNGGGEHIGGLIAPGLSLMARSLTQGTAQLRLDKMQTVSGFGTNTENGISLGCRESVAGVIRQTAERVEAILTEEPVWFVTGGEAPSILTLSPIKLEPVPDLVLRGLVIVAERMK